MPIEDVGIFHEACELRKPTLPKCGAEKLLGKYRAPVLIRNNREVRNARVSQEHVVETQQSRIDCGRVLYLEKRLGRQMTNSFRGRKTLLALWKRQRGRCPHCHEVITTTTGWHSHHQVWRSHGGSDTVDNRVLLHPTCHRQLHSSLGSTRVPHPVTRVFGKA